MSNILDLIFSGNANGDNGGTPVVERPPVVAPAETEKPALPPMYAVVLHNDNSTHPFFVGKVLVEAFGLENEAAFRLMNEVHHNGSKVVLVTTKDAAETRLDTAKQMISVAQPGRDFYLANTANGTCELNFTVRPETAGE